MLITVAICTWNRAKLLDQTLAEMCKLTLPTRLEWELLVVNNNCTDETDGVLGRYEERLPIRRLFEAKQGHSNARNCALAAAKGSWILWTDDDVLVHQDWLAEYVLAMARWPGVTILGGPVEPWFEGSPPQWLSRTWTQISDAYATRDLGKDPIPFTHKQLPFGANFAIRTSEQVRYPYDPTLGRKRHSLIGDDEVTVLRKMLSDGHEGRWVPNARLLHYIPKQRQTIRYLRRWFFAQGVVNARGEKADYSVKLFGKPRWLVRRALETELRYRWRRLVRPPEVWVEDLELSSATWGLLWGFPLHSPE